MSSNKTSTPLPDSIEACLAFHGQTVLGEISNYNESIGLLCFQFDEGQPFNLPKINQKMRLNWKGNTFSAQTILLELSQDRWILSLPTQMKTAIQRSTKRFEVNGEWIFKGVDGIERDLHDISEGGIGLLLPPNQPMGSAGWKMRGILSYFDEKWDLELTSTNLRAHRFQHDWHVIGCRFSLLDSTKETSLFRRINHF